MKPCALLFLFFSLTSVAFASTAKISIVDACSKKPVSLTTPNGSLAMIEIAELQRNAPLTLELVFSPAGLPEEIAEKQALHYRYHYEAGEFSNPFTLSVRLPTRGDSAIWNATVYWIQEKNTGNATTSVYRTDNEDSFYKALTTTLCKWETPPVLSSDYLYNEDQPTMEISRDVQTLQDNGVFSGIQADEQPGLGSNNPLFPFAAFFFKSFETNSSLHQTLTLEREWTLGKKQGAIFADRFSFNRVLAARYEWNQHYGSCGEYRRTQDGYFDVGIRTSELYSAPLSYAANPEKILAFIEEFRPTFNNCRGNYENIPKNTEVLLNSSTYSNKIVLFYRNQLVQENL